MARPAVGAAAFALVTALSACGGGSSSSSSTVAGGAAGGSAPASTPAASPPGCDPNAPGSCDAYKSDDPYVAANDAAGAVAPKTIVMAGFAFSPTTVTAKPGEMWTEQNKDVATHNITSDADLKKLKGSQTGGDIAPDVMAGKSQTFKMPTKPGTYKAVCFYHQNMLLTIVVKK